MTGKQYFALIADLTLMIEIIDEINIETMIKKVVCCNIG